MGTNSLTKGQLHYRKYLEGHIRYRNNPINKENKRLYDIEYRKEHRDKRTENGKAYYKQNKHKTIERMGRFKKRREELINIKGGGCMDCGIVHASEVLEFHHRDPSIKEFTLGKASMSKSWESVLLEAEKTDLLCRNCHTYRHLAMKQEGRTKDA